MVRTDDHHWDELEPLLPPWGLWPTFHKVLAIVALLAALLVAIYSEHARMANLEPPAVQRVEPAPESSEYESIWLVDQIERKSR